MNLCEKNEAERAKLGLCAQSDLIEWIIKEGHYENAFRYAAFRRMSIDIKNFFGYAMRGMKAERWWTSFNPYKYREIMRMHIKMCNMYIGLGKVMGVDKEVIEAIEEALNMLNEDVESIEICESWEEKLGEKVRERKM